jgi:hypothetical protein
MVGWTRFYLMEHAEALEDALEAIKMATAVSHRRANLLGLMLSGLVEFEFGRFVEAQGYLEAGLTLAGTMSASNFEAQILGALAALSAAQAKIAQARDFAERAVEVVRKVGMTFVGPSVLATKAALTDNQHEGARALEEAESILDSGCVAHNHFWFARTAMDHALSIGDWDSAERYAGRLEAYTREQPLPWSDFLIARGRALAAWGRGTRNADVLGELRRLHQVTVQQGLKPIAFELERALVAT